MEAKYLRPILTAKEPKNKNVLWCHDGKISYYDKDWKDISGGSSEVTDLSTSVLQNSLLQLSSGLYSLSSSINIHSDVLKGDKLSFNTGTFDTINVTKVNIEGLELSSRDVKQLYESVDISTTYFSISLSTIMTTEQYSNLNGNSITFANRISSYAGGYGAYLIYVSSELQQTQLLNLSSCYMNPIHVSNEDSSKWTLSDAQNILNQLQIAGYFRITTKS